VNAATIFGTGVGCSLSTAEAHRAFAAGGPRGVRPTAVPRCMANAISSQISMSFHLIGANYVTVSACTSSSTAIGIAYRMIRDGWAEQSLCGGADAPFEPVVFAGWDNLSAMSRNPDPQTACRPFDALRDGCVLGEGAGALVLESLESARRRGAKIHAEIAGYGESSDAGHITRPSVEGQARAMRTALESAGIKPPDLGFIDAHGTATKTNDECESQSIRAVLADAADRIPVSANKSAFGHLLGACGVVETIASILGLQRGVVPPNLNLTQPDPACRLNLVQSEPMALRATVAMKNTFGFGGCNAVLLLRKWAES
jgi:3-oxoacyl-[acyl-carrier-protein] synthase II